MVANPSEKEEVKAFARVIVTLEIDLTQPWGADCSMDQIWKQAKDQTQAIVERLRDRERQGFRVIGDVAVRAIIVPEVK